LIVEGERFCGKICTFEIATHKTLYLEERKFSAKACLGMFFSYFVFQCCGISGSIQFVYFDINFGDPFFSSIVLVYAQYLERCLGSVARECRGRAMRFTEA